MTRYWYHGRRRKGDWSLVWWFPAWLAWRESPIADHFIICAGKSNGCDV